MAMLVFALTSTMSSAMIHCARIHVLSVNQGMFVEMEYVIYVKLVPTRMILQVCFLYNTTYMSEFKMI